DQISFDQGLNTFFIDEDLNGDADYEFRNPEFNFLQFRSNLVLRWEYKPGSEFFVVWTQSTTNFGDPEKKLLPSLTEDLFGDSFDNIFLVKFTHRFFRT
ncbi:MAG: hydrolase, partial [Bacteroidia bacterium]|nr:hydrolase [Bacteroidia bacterium]